MNLVSTPAGKRGGLRAVGAHPATLTPLDARVGPRDRALPAPRAPGPRLVGAPCGRPPRRGGAGGWLSDEADAPSLAPKGAREGASDGAT